MSKGCVWDDIMGQRKAVAYLRAAADSGTISHAYLLVGPPGAGKKTAARALACAVMCDDGGCGSCRVCYRIKKGQHPDVRLFEPEGAASYLLDEQIRPLIHDVQMRPVEASHTFYVLDQADMFNDSCANALLKTLEEPPPHAVMILLAPRYDSVLPTIASRCQVVRFSRVSPSEAARLLETRTGAGPEEAAAALAATGGVLVRAAEFLASSGRQAARDRMLAILKDLAVFDELDVLTSAKALLALAKAPVDELKVAQAAEIKQREEFSGASVGKAVEGRHKRELTAREREGIAEVLNIAESWLRDCLAISQGVEDLVANRDVIDAMQEVGAVITPGACARALNAVNEARRRISYNVSPQLAVEAMLFDIREVLTCPR